MRTNKKNNKTLFQFNDSIFTTVIVQSHTKKENGNIINFNTCWRVMVYVPKFKKYFYIGSVTTLFSPGIRQQSMNDKKENCVDVSISHAIALYHYLCKKEHRTEDSLNLFFNFSLAKKSKYFITVGDEMRYKIWLKLVKYLRTKEYPTMFENLKKEVDKLIKALNKFGLDYRQNIK